MDGGTSLRQVLDALGCTVLRAARAPQGLEAAVTGVCVQDPVEPVRAAPGEILLGVGIERDEQVAALLEAAGRRGAAAVVVKHTGGGTDCGSTALLHLARPASWSQVAALIDGLLEAGEVGRLTGGGPAEEDLFATANAVGALIGAPLVIEDRSARVLAYSGGQEQADEVRKRTILARRDPAEYVELHRRLRVFDELYAGDRPLLLAPVGDERMPRLAVALRAGSQIVGSMWAAVRHEPAPEQLDRYADAARTVALHVLRARAVADVEARLRDDLLGRILAGGAGAAEAAGRLGLPRQPHRMVAVRFEADPPGGGEDVRNLAAALRMHLAAVRSRCVVRCTGGTVHAAVPVDGNGGDSGDGDDGGSALLHLLADFAAHRSAGPRAVRCAVGRGARTAAGLRRSQQDCEKVLRVMDSGQVAGRVARVQDVQLPALLLRLSDALASGEEELDGPAGALIAYDLAHRTTMAETLLTHFAVFGDATAAAGRLHVHPNTYRYRLRRVTAISGLDLADPDAVLAAVLQLRLHRLARPPR